MSDQVTAPASEDAGPDDMVWAKSPATGRKKQMTAKKLGILRLAGWEPCDDPDGGDPLVVKSFPSGPSEEAGQQPGQVVVETPPVGVDGAEPGQNDQQRSRTGRRAAAEQEGS